MHVCVCVSASRECNYSMFCVKRSVISPQADDADHSRGLEELWTAFTPPSVPGCHYRDDVIPLQHSAHTHTHTHITFNCSLRLLGHESVLKQTANSKRVQNFKAVTERVSAGGGNGFQ